MRIRPTQRDIDVANLRLDPDNPRFVAQRDTDELAEFLPWFNGDADLLAVASSIATNGYHAAEPLLVAPRGDGDPRLVVVEGNRRFAAVLVLLNPDYLPRIREFRQLAEGADLDDLRVLPCLEYADRDDILNYLGNRHVVGVREWKPLAKARYVRQLRERAQKCGEPADDKTLAKQIGSNGPYVRRLLNSLEAFEAVNLEQAKDEAKFSVLQTALQYSQISDFVGIGARTPEGEADIKPGPLQELADWTLKPTSDSQKGPGAPRVNTRSLAKLNEVVAAPEALDAFRAGASIDHAHRLTGAGAAALLEALAEVDAALSSALTQANRLGEAPSSAHRGALAQIRDKVAAIDGAFDSAATRASQ